MTGPRDKRSQLMEFSLLSGRLQNWFGLLEAILINWVANVFNPALDEIIITAWIISNHYNIWFATGSNIFYLFKIANFSSLIFLTKWRTKSVLLVIKLGPLFFLAFQFVVVRIDETIQTDEYKENFTQKTKLRDIVYLSNMTLFTLVNLYYVSYLFCC